jgi:transcription termination/antitermination protein NusA
MNSELSAILSYMEKERGVDRETLIKAVEEALQTVSQRVVGVAGRDVRVAIDRTSCDIKAFARKTVVPEAEGDAADTISLSAARRRKADVELGDVVEVEVTPRNFGRIAAQSAKQTIVQKIRQAERANVYEDYKDRVGDIVSGSVKLFNRSDIIVDIGRGEALLPATERVPTEEYQTGERIRACILRAQNSAVGPALIVSRSHPDFLRRLFEIEVSEIADGVVEIMGVVREPGYRAKIAVKSNNEKVDPVGACVGMRGMRVKNIVRELSGEKIDIVRWSEDILTYAANALSPAKLARIWVDEQVPHLLRAECESDQLSLAIGKRGQNVRLSSRLLDWKIDIQKIEEETTFEEKVQKAVERLVQIDGIESEQADALVRAGFLSAEGILAAELTDLTEATGLSEAECQALYEAAAKAQQEAEEE